MGPVLNPSALVVPDRSWFDRPVRVVARDLLGAVVESDSADGLVALRLTEVEAYDGANDPGSHAFRGRTARNASMFGSPGHAYVYFTYGMHFCVNLVCAPVGRAAAVLLRAGQVISGIELARTRRPGISDRELARGPARLTRTLGIDGRLDGADLLDPESPLRVRIGPPVADRLVVTTPRTGLRQGGDRLWRFALGGDPTVSRYRPAAPRRARGGPTGVEDSVP